ncbi:MAG: hypothetical protein SFH39_00725 [Candidatus Magnetobacterium sp. LHC-1]
MAKSAWDEYVKPNQGTDFSIVPRPPVYGDGGGCPVLSAKQRQEEADKLVVPSAVTPTSVTPAAVAPSPDTPDTLVTSAKDTGKLQGPPTPVGFSNSQDVVLNSTDNRWGFPTNYVNGVAVYDNDTLKDRASRVTNFGSNSGDMPVSFSGGLGNFAVPTPTTTPQPNRASEVLSKPVEMPEYGTVSVSGDAHPGGWLVEAMHNRAQMHNFKNYNKGVEGMRKYLQDLQGKQADQANADHLLQLNQLNADRQYGLGLLNAQTSRMSANASMLSAAAQARPDNKPMILSQGQTAFGLGGKPIASVPGQKDTRMLDRLSQDISAYMQKRYLDPAAGASPGADKGLAELQRRYDDEYNNVYSPVPDAKMAKDGQWYVQQPDGKWGKVVQ